MRATDYKQSFKEGDKAEDSFESVANKLGLSTRKATFSENVHKHIDWWLDDRISVDVKARKRSSRASTQVQDEWLWVEFKNVSGRPGWLYGEAYFIALERADGFVLVRREDLVALSEELVDFNVPVTSAAECEYKPYTRRGRKDVISKIRFSDVLNKLECLKWRFVNDTP